MGQSHSTPAPGGRIKDLEAARLAYQKQQGMSGGRPDMYGGGGGSGDSGWPPMTDSPYGGGASLDPRMLQPYGGRQPFGW